MSFPRYETYKDSGFEWLGDVPEHWVIAKTSRYFKIAMGQTILKEDLVDDGLWPVFSATDGDHYFGLVNNPQVRLTIGDLVIPARGNSIGAVKIVKEPSTTTQTTIYCKNLASERLKAEYVYYFMRGFRNNLFYFTQTAIPQITVEEVSSNPIFLPPLSEQQTIAAFLDRETAKIDALIAEQQRLLELLKEKRQALISHAVTKGLNPDAPMKESGIEWLGEVPAHWIMKRLKNISPFIAVGIVVNPSEYVSEEGLPFIYGGDISEGKIDTQNCRRISDTDSHKNAKTRLVVGDLLTVRVGAPGITAVVTEECEGGNCASVMLVRKGDFVSNWLCYAMNSRMVRFQVEVVQYGAAQEQFNISHAVNFWIATPPVEEQRSILTFLDNETIKLDTLTTEAKTAIKLLQERRTALISAAVTGKIDVRGLVSTALPEEAAA